MVETKVSLLTGCVLPRPPAVVFVNSSKGALLLADAVNKVGNQNLIPFLTP